MVTSSQANTVEKGLAIVLTGIILVFLSAHWIFLGQLSVC